MELFEERGFEETTVADIAERAGLTKRTFFRYFADKREVLFAGTEELKDEIRRRRSPPRPADAPRSTRSPLGLDAMADLSPIGDRRRQRQAIIAANPELQERELIKMIAFAAAARRGPARPRRRRTGRDPRRRGGHRRPAHRLRAVGLRLEGPGHQEAPARRPRRAEGGRRVRVGTPFGEYPFEYRRVERRADGVAIVGTVAGIESTVVLDKDDALRAAKALAIPVGATALLLVARAARRNNP